MILDELIKQIPDDNLRERIKSEVDKLTKKFGLVFESKDEFFPRPDLPVKKFSLVAKVGKLDETFRVTDIDGDKITCSRDKETFEFNRDEIICVNRLGSPVYPGLTKLDEVCNAPDSELWHLLIEAENYHALQLLKYPFAGKVDCIYIDPPYNTGARDWKYNNDYVDAADRYRHSKWLAMMERRLLLAKDLLKPDDSVLIVTIDEHEYLHLGCLLEDIFGGANIQMVSIINNRAGTGRAFDFARINEYAFFVRIGNAVILPEFQYGGEHKSVLWDVLRRSELSNVRQKTKSQFYPIFIDKDTGKIHSVGEPLAPHVEASSIVAPEGCTAVFPIRDDGIETSWSCKREELLIRLAKGYIKVGKATSDKPQKYSLSYIKTGAIADIASGKAVIEGYNADGSVRAFYASQRKKNPPTILADEKYDARTHGSGLLATIIGKGKFSYPKSLYAVGDCLRFVVANKPDALILDFFAGSGTTLHAVNLLNATDGGNRRCILVTNNEGDIARSVTWQRTVCSIEGHDINGAPLNGNYLGTDLAMSDGFKSNAAFFALNCLDKNSVELGEQFNQTLPVLWLKAGGIGRCPTFDEKTLPPYKIFAENKFAVLFDESHFTDFANELDGAQIETFFAVTGSDNSLNDIAKQLRVKRSFRLYEDYLENFKLEEVTR